MKPYKRPYFEIANPEIPNVMRGLPRGLDVLDVGCGSGVHGAELKRLHGHRVVGVDLSEASIGKAKSRLEEAYVADVTKPEQYTFYGKRQFDVVVFSDVLEHLYDPSDVLERHIPLIAPGGHLVISLPNLVIWNVRFALLFGRFEYQDTGTLDRTHIRFFTCKSIRRFIEDAGFRVLRQRVTPGISRPFVPLIKEVFKRAGALDGKSDSSSIMDSAPYRFYMKWLWPIERAICTLWPGMLAFSLVVLAEPTIARRPVATRADTSEQLEKLSV